MFYYEIDFLEENTKKVKKDKGIIAGDKWDEVVKRLVDYYGNYDVKDDFGLISIEKLYPLEEVLDRHSMAGLFDLLVPYEKEKKKSSDKITDEQIDQLLDCMAKGEYDGYHNFFKKGENERGGIV